MIIMNEKTTQLVIFGGIIVLVIIAFLQIEQKQTIISSDTSPKISVSGMAEKEVLPDEVVILLTITTEGRDAKQVQDKNSQQMNAVIKALTLAGIKDKEIETTGYSLYPWQEWDSMAQKTVNKGYRLQQTITLTTKEITKTGELVDLAVKNGINTVNGISFRLSMQREQEVRQELVSLASSQAREKAEILAKSLKVSLGDVIYATESNLNNGPWYYSGMMKAVAMEAASAPDIAPEQVKVSIQVNVDYEVD